MASGRINVDGAGLYYELTGEPGAPVVALHHCFAADHRYWDPHLTAFAGFRVLRFDARGHGLSDVSPGPYSLEMLAASSRA